MSTTNGKKPSKIDQKKQQIMNERINRYVNDGMSFEDAIARIQAEDYKALPVEKKIVFLEAMMRGSDQALARDIQTLQHNDNVIAQNLDINFGAITMALESLGITREQQQDLLKKSTERYETEMQARAAAQQAAASKKTVAQVEEQIVQELESESKIAPESAPQEVPEGATSFGG